jgi:hypothetical protein
VTVVIVVELDRVVAAKNLSGYDVRRASLLRITSLSFYMTVRRTVGRQSCNLPFTGTHTTEPTHFLYSYVDRTDAILLSSSATTTTVAANATAASAIKRPQCRATTTHSKSSTPPTTVSMLCDQQQ